MLPVTAPTMTRRINPDTNPRMITRPAPSFGWAEGRTPSSSQGPAAKIKRRAPAYAVMARARASDREIGRHVACQAGQELGHTLELWLATLSNLAACTYLVATLLASSTFECAWLCCSFPSTLTRSSVPPPSAKWRSFHLISSVCGMACHLSFEKKFFCRQGGPVRLKHRGMPITPPPPATSREYRTHLVNRFYETLLGRTPE